MSRRGRPWGRATLAVLACMAPCRSAVASGHRVAAVDPDPEVARALDVALSPWEVTLVDVHLDSPGATMPMAVDRARAIATDASAEVVVWVSSADDGFAVWIYDAASDHASARKLDRAPPFDGPTAAGVALSVKTLLRGTSVAPPPERFGVAPTESPWRVGLAGGVAQRIQASSPVEARLGVEASGWLGRWGLMLDVEGAPAGTPRAPPSPGPSPTPPFAWASVCTCRSRHRWPSSLPSAAGFACCTSTRSSSPMRPTPRWSASTGTSRRGSASRWGSSGSDFA